MIWRMRHLNFHLSRFAAPSRPLRKRRADIDIIFAVEEPVFELSALAGIEAFDDQILWRGAAKKQSPTRSPSGRGKSLEHTAPLKWQVCFHPSARRRKRPDGKVIAASGTMSSQRRKRLQAARVSKNVGRPAIR